jgi:sugar (pentulose or hexulose) kinase
MQHPPPRGIAVLDVGYTNAKIQLFDADLTPLAQRSIASSHLPGPPYAHLDPEPVYALARAALPAFDAELPIDVIVPTAHGAALALIDAAGGLALPVMDYQAEPPPEVVAEYRLSEPPFSEVFCPLLPMALTHALQLHWQERAWPRDFARVAAIMPYVQYAALRLAGARVSEISSLSCQSQLMDVPNARFSSLARARGWDRKIAPIAKAWETVGPLQEEFRGEGFRGSGRVVAGAHDSNGNYLRYLAAGLGEFTLLSTGTWIISFDPGTALDTLDPRRDTASNTDVLGRQVATSRFFGGKEMEIVLSGARAEAASFAAVQRLIARGSFALPSFTDSGGPLPGAGGKGGYAGPAAESAEERASLAALYVALMVDQQLDAVGSRHRIVVDGPFAMNDVFLGLLAALRPGQPVLASDLRDGTAAGTAVLGLMNATGELPRIGLKPREAATPAVAGVADYKALWLAASQ